MRFSRVLIPTVKETPSETQVISHTLMIRSGLIRQLSAGIYTWLPIGLRVLRKVENIVREEMDAAGAQEVLMPAVQPSELWRESGRWDFYGKELLRITDRHNRAFCFGPTHEEVIADLVRREVRSYKELPANFYQIQTKFRDEIRPRFGVMRGREFLMKDAYSFNLDQESLDESYQSMFDAYVKIFERCGLRFRPVEADTGTIGGAASHEFHVLAESGEDTIVSCSDCSYAANLEKAVSGAAQGGESLDASTIPEMARTETPGQKSIDDVVAYLKIPVEKTIKTLVAVDGEGEWTLLLLRGDHELNEAKARVLLGDGFRIPTPEEVAEKVGPVGSLGPVGSELTVLADEMLEKSNGFVCGANEEGWHLTNVCWDRDLPRPRFVDVRNVTVGEPCAHCGSGTLAMDRGIEVGHVFKLGDKYSRAMNVTVLGPDGRETVPEMGCYGIGVSRVVAAAIEQNHDDNGIVWPLAIAPFSVEILLLNPKDANASGIAETLYSDLNSRGIETILDDRDERMGVKFKDADLLGAPLRVLVGGRSLKEGVLELQTRKGGKAERVPPQEIVAELEQRLAALR
ncbi:MAG: proline--tRNA ligase [Magnetococcales bacterium]|nr:proline--tRNA ligase [Magnetococcales bacterium]